MKFIAPFVLSVGLAAVAADVPRLPAGAVSRRPLLSVSLDQPKTLASVQAQEITLAPGTHVPLHLHPCAVVGVVHEGEIAFQVEGKAVQHLRAGDAFHEPAEARVARFDNEGTSPARFTAFYLLPPGAGELIRVLPESQ